MMPNSIYHGKILEVTVFRCTNLKDLERFTKQDPYVYIEYGNSRFRSKTWKGGGQCPTFHPRFLISLIDGIQEMNLLVWNSNTLTAHQLIGSGKIQLHRLISQGIHDRSWPIFDEHNWSAGEVKLFLYCSSLNVSRISENIDPFDQIPQYIRHIQSTDSKKKGMFPGAEAMMSLLRYHGQILEVTDGGRNPKFQERFSISLIEGIQEMNLLIWNSNTFTSHDLIGSGRIQLDKLISQGIDDRSWMIFDEHNRSTGEVKIFLYCPTLNQPRGNTDPQPVFCPLPSLHIPQAHPMCQCSHFHWQQGTYPGQIQTAHPTFCPHQRLLLQHSYSNVYPPQYYPSG